MFKMKTGCFNALARGAATKAGFTKPNRSNSNNALRRVLGYSALT